MKKYILLVSMIAALVALSASAAVGVLPLKQQTESKAATSFGAPYNDGAAAEPANTLNSWRYTGNGTLNYTFTVAQGDSVTSATLRAKNSINSGSSVFASLIVNGTETTGHTLGTLNAGTYVEKTWNIGPLGPGTHTIGVRGGSIDAATNDKMMTDWVQLNGTSTPADTTPPDTSITSGPAEGSTDTDGSVSFAFSGTDNVGVTGFECSLVAQGQAASYTACSSPKDYTALANGSYTFSVRTKDAAGNVDGSPATRNFSVSVPPPQNCEVNIGATQDLDAIVNADSPTVGTTFCAAAATYNIDNPVEINAGDELLGVPGTTTTRGPATYANNPATVLIGVGVDKVVSVQSSNYRLEWLDISGADGRINLNEPSTNCPASQLPSGCPVVGTGIGIAMGQADGTGTVSYLRVHDNDASGISNAHGRIKNSEFFSNTLDPAFLGVVASAVKGITEFEASNLYVHNEQGNGVWHDHSLSTSGADGGNDPAMSSNPGGGSWFHNILSVNNGRKGLRYEYTPRDAAEGQHLLTPSIMIENNSIHGNGDEGVSIRDAQNATVQNNTFGAVTISGVTYTQNGDKNTNGIGDAVIVSDSGRSDRTDTMFVTVSGNTLNGEEVRCTAPGPSISCQ